MRLQPDGTYVATDRPVFFYLGAVILAFQFAVAWWQRYHLHGFDLGTIGLLFGVMASIAAGLALPSSRFVFDPGRKRIAWAAQSMFKGDGGTVDFADVKEVVLQTMHGSDDIPAYRVALRTTERTIPLGIEYSANRDAVERLAEQIRALLQMPPETP